MSGSPPNRMPAMGKLDFAFWDSIPHIAAGAGIADELDAHIRLAQTIERLGWHSYFVIEHQNAPQGTSAPSVYLTAVARETSRLRLGAMMWQLPLYHPLRLAQDVAMLDQLSRGRVEFGTGIGVHEHEFIRWGMDYYQRAAISEEVLAMVKMAWTRSEVTYDGGTSTSTRPCHTRGRTSSRTPRSGRRSTATRRSSSPRATTTTWPRTWTPTRWSPASSTCTASSGARAATPVRCRASF